MPDPAIVASENIASLRQGVELLNKISDEVYAKSSPPLFASSIGVHVRHCVDHYASFFAGLGEGRIDYEARKRDSRIEKERNVAIFEMNEHMARLNMLSDDSSGDEIVVKTENQGAASWARSTVARELDFLLSHTVHHYALIAFILRSEGIDPGSEFGVAPSTLRFLSRTSTCAP